MRIHTLRDYVLITYQLAGAFGMFSNFSTFDPSEHGQKGADLAGKFREILDGWAEILTDLNLTRTRELFVSAVEQIGDPREVEETILDELAREIAENVALQESPPCLPLDLWHDPARLRADIMSLLPAGVYAGLPAMAQQDLVDAGRCLADRQPTAAAMMLLRCMETVARDLYRELTGSEASGLELDRLERAIGDALSNPDGMKGAYPTFNQSSPAHHESGKMGIRGMYVVSMLRDIRINHRNPAMHGEKRYDIDESQRLFSLVKEALARMAECLSDRRWPPGVA